MKAPLTLPPLPPFCSQLALALLLARGPTVLLIPTTTLSLLLSLGMPPTPWPLSGTDSWSFGRTHLTTGEEHFLTEELMSSSGLFKPLKRQTHKNTSVSYYLRHSCAKYKSSASHSPSSEILRNSAPQFWNCLKFQMLLPVKIPRYQTAYCWSHPELLNS